MFFGDPRILRRRNRNVHTIGMRHEKLCVCLIQRIRHLLDVVRWGCTTDLAANAQSGVHGDGIPNGVLAEQRDGLAFFKAILLD